MTQKPWPVLMKQTDIVGMKRAEEMSGRDARTVKRWCLDYGIGHQSAPNAPWEISGPALAMIRHGDFEALELLRAGNRSSPQVTRIFDFTGFEP